jgi:protein-tyrosine-phosphatase
MAEAIARSVAGDAFEVFSCGSQPAGYVHPLAIATLEAMGLPTDKLESKGWDEFLKRDIDVAISVCEDAAKICPTFPGAGIHLQWPMPDPSFLPAPEEERLEYCMRVAQRMKVKIERLVALDFDKLTGDALKRELEFLADL